MVRCKPYTLNSYNKKTIQEKQNKKVVNRKRTRRNQAKEVQDHPGKRGSNADRRNEDITGEGHWGEHQTIKKHPEGKRIFE